MLSKVVKVGVSRGGVALGSGCRVDRQDIRIEEMVRMAKNLIKPTPQTLSSRRWPLYPSEMGLMACSTVEAMYQGVGGKRF